MKRRDFHEALLAAALLPVSYPAAATPDRWQAIEQAVGGRLGVAVLDTANGRTEGHRLDERFPMCSVFKWLAAAAVLKRVDDGQATLQQRIRFGREALLPTSPVTEQRVGGDGMTLAELCEAAVTQSDNAAANLLLRQLGGPAAVTRFVRTLGDDKTRLDRYEMKLNEARPGDPRDTSTPRAMTVSLQAALLGNGLSATGCEQLQQWMLANRTGGPRLRAGVPGDWRVADRTGTGARGTSNVVGVLWPPGRAPLVVAAFLTGSPADGDRRNAALADVGRTLAR